MKEINVTGQKRTDLGKKASKTLRKEGLIPCNLYGEKKGENGAPEALSFAVPFAELRTIVRSIVFCKERCIGSEFTSQHSSNFKL